MFLSLSFLLGWHIYLVLTAQVCFQILSCNYKYALNSKFCFSANSSTLSLVICRTEVTSDCWYTIQTTIDFYGNRVRQQEAHRVGEVQLLNKAFLLKGAFYRNCFLKQLQGLLLFPASLWYFLQIFLCDHLWMFPYEDIWSLFLIVKRPVLSCILLENYPLTKWDFSSGVGPLWISIGCFACNINNVL